MSNDKLAGILTWIKTSNSQIIELIQIIFVLILNIKVKNFLTMSRVQLFILKLFLSVQGALTHNCEYNRTNELARSASSYQIGISKIPKIIIQYQLGWMSRVDKKRTANSDKTLNIHSLKVRLGTTDGLVLSDQI